MPSRTGSDLWRPCRMAPVARPAPAVDQAGPGIAGMSRVDGDLGVLDPPGGAGVLALHPTDCVPPSSDPRSHLPPERGLEVAEILTGSRGGRRHPATATV